MLGGMGLFVWQIYAWLKSSLWPSVSVIDALRWMGVSWAVAPHDWLGLHKLLNLVPLALTLFIVGLAITSSVSD